MVFLAGTSTLPGLVVRTESGGDGSQNDCFLRATVLGHCCSQCSTRAFRVDNRVKLIGVSIKEGV